MAICETLYICLWGWESGCGIWMYEEINWIIMRMILATKNFKTRYIKKLELRNITLITFQRAAFPQMNVIAKGDENE